MLLQIPLPKPMTSLDLTLFVDKSRCEHVRRWSADVKAGLIPDPLRPRVPGKHEPYGLEKSTVRAFRVDDQQWPDGPKRLFGSWVEARHDNLLKDGGARPKTQSDFDDWHSKFVRELAAHWKRKGGEELPIAHRYKVADLYVKCVARHADAPPDLRTSFQQFAHCPLDKKSLAVLGDALSNVLLVRGTKCSMGAIYSVESYHYHQQLVTFVASWCGITPLMFDCYAWDEFSRRYPSKSVK